MRIQLKQFTEPIFSELATQRSTLAAHPFLVAANELSTPTLHEFAFHQYSDSILWIERLINAFGSPNWIYGTELCNWHKDHARAYTFGVGVTTPDFANTGCVLLWGHNPSTSWLTHATGAAAGVAGGLLVSRSPRRS